MQLKRVLSINQPVLNAGPGTEPRAGGTSPGTWGNSPWRKDDANTESHCKLPLS